MTENQKELPKLKSRSEFQWKRKGFHLFNGLLGFYLYVYSGLPEIYVLAFCAFCLLISLTVDILRMKYHNFNLFICNFFKGIIREGEKHKITSVTKGLLGSLIALSIFPREVDMVVILIVTFADPMGALVGSKFGKHRVNQHASLEGCIGVYAVSILAGMFVIWKEAIMFESYFGIGIFLLVVGFIGAIAELSFPKWDDNWVIPMLASPSLYLLYRLLGHNFPLFKLHF